MICNEDSILRYIYTFRRLNATQVAHLFSAESWITTIRSKLSHMTEEEFLFRCHYPTESPGFSPWMYELGKKGRQYLKKTYNFTVFPPRDEQVKYKPVMHDIYINDFLIAATKALNVELVDVRHDWLLHHTPIKLSGSDVREFIIPDGFLNFHYVISGNDYNMPIWFELDTGTETNISYFKLKIRSILAGIYTTDCEEILGIKKKDGIPMITVAFATSGSYNRLKTIREWTFQEMTRLGRIEDSDLFLFTRLPHARKNGKETDQLELDAQFLFLRKCWLLSNNDAPLSLLDMS